MYLNGMGFRAKVWLGTAINHYRSGVLAIQIGDRSGKTFEKLWERVKKWDSQRYLTDGYCVYANYIEPEKQAVLPKTKLTRVEGENTRLRLTSRYSMLLEIAKNVMVFNPIIDVLLKI